MSRDKGKVWYEKKIRALTEEIAQKEDRFKKFERVLSDSRYADQG